MSARNCRAAQVAMGERVRYSFIGKAVSFIGKAVRRFAILGSILGLALMIFALPAATARAADAPAGSAASTEPAIPAALAARMEKEKEARKTCKQQICRLLLRHKADDGAATGTLQCDVTKTWLKSTIEKRILRGKLSWPWSNAQCRTRIRLDRAMLSGARKPGKRTIKLEKHTIACSLDRGAGKRFDVSFAVAPEVTFEDGKPTTVSMNWTDIKAPTLAKGVIWSATRIDNTLGVLETSMVDAVDHFLAVSCKEVGVE